MVIDKINIEAFAAFKPKNNPPISADGNGEKPLQFSFQGVQTKSRNIHGLNFLGGVQGGENQLYPRYHIRRQLAAIVMLKQPLQAFVPKIPDH
ncbi:MAG: hypothetical protein L6277_15635 [Desulfobacterales bacterium]|nr:hypothetical protein [Desulfobacterales bacterium]